MQAMPRILYKHFSVRLVSLLLHGSFLAFDWLQIISSQPFNFQLAGKKTRNLGAQTTCVCIVCRIDYDWFWWYPDNSNLLKLYSAFIWDWEMNSIHFPSKTRPLIGQLIRSINYRCGFWWEMAGIHFSILDKRWLHL